MKCRGRLLKLIVLIAGMAATLSFSDAQEAAKMETVLLPSSSPLVSFRILFQVGSASDPQGKGCSRIDCGHDFGGRNPEVILLRDRSSHVSDGHRIFVSGRQGNDGFHRKHPQRQPPEIL